MSDSVIVALCLTGIFLTLAWALVRILEEFRAYFIEDCDD